MRAAPGARGPGPGHGRAPTGSDGTDKHVSGDLERRRRRGRQLNYIHVLVAHVSSHVSRIDS